MSGIKKITSPQNPVVKEAARLLKKREAGGPFLIEGTNTLETALRKGSRVRVQKLFVTEIFALREKALFEMFLSAAASAEVFELSPRAMDRITDTGSPQGIAAMVTVEPASLFDIEPGASLVVVADGVQDPGNLGTIIRTADAAGADAVVLTEAVTCDPVNPKVLRASAGSVFNLPVIRGGRPEIIAALRSLGLRIIVSAPVDGLTCFDADLASPMAIVLGNERRGVGEEFLAVADQVVSIPVYGEAESLSVSAAAAVLLFEAVRQSLA